MSIYIHHIDLSGLPEFLYIIENIVWPSFYMYTNEVYGRLLLMPSV